MFNIDNFGFHTNYLQNCVYECASSNVSTGDFTYSGNAPPVSIRFRLKNSIQNWINLGASKFVLETIEDGYKIPFIDSLTSFIASNKSGT